MAIMAVSKNTASENCSAQGLDGEVRHEQDAPGRKRVRQRRSHGTACVRHLRCSLRQFLPPWNNLHEMRTQEFYLVSNKGYDLNCLCVDRNYFEHKLTIF